MNKKLKMFIAFAGLGLASCHDASKISVPDDIIVKPAAVQCPAQQTRRTEPIPEFTAEEAHDINMPTFYELGGDAGAITDTQIAALYKLHAQNKNLDGLSTHGYDRVFLSNVQKTAAQRADGTFSLYANALQIARYSLARLHGRINKDTLFQIKMDLMVPLTGIHEAEKEKYGTETRESNELLYRISYMEEQQLREIIERLEQRLPSAFPPNNRRYGENVAQLISDTSEYLGWTEGLKIHGLSDTVPHSVYAALDTDMVQFNLGQPRVEYAAAK